MSRLYVGTCSWKYDDWRGLVYPETGKINYLQEYARHFNTVEIDQWFWSLFPPDIVKLPDPVTARAYAQAVPADFKFTIKVPNSITLTHFYKKQKINPLTENPHFLSREIWEKFLERISILRHQTGMLLFQFEYLNRQKMKSPAEFLGKLKRFVPAIPAGLRCGIELRNPNYLTEEYFRGLNQLGLHHVFMQGYFMPDIIGLYQRFASHIQEVVTIRLMGPDRKGIEQAGGEKWNRIIWNRDLEIRELSEWLNLLRERKLEIFLNINNHFEGSAPLTAEKFKNYLR